MVRTIVIVVTLLAQVISTCANGVFVLCVHKDGQTMIEFAWAACCSSDPSRCHCGAAFCSRNAPTEQSPITQVCSAHDADDCDCGCRHDDVGDPSNPVQEGQGRSALRNQCDHCTDYPLLTSLQMASAEFRHRQNDTDRLVVVHESQYLSLSEVLPQVVSHSQFNGCGPPGDTVSPHIPTTILRC